MINWFVKLVYDSQPVELVSDYSLDESVDRLWRAIKPWSPVAFLASGPVGEVTAGNVRIEWVTPMFGNPFKPMFLGKFVERSSGKVTLVGRFTISKVVKAFMTFWFGALALCSPISLFAMVSGGPQAWIRVVAVPGMFLAGCVLVYCGKRWSRRDSERLSDVITQSLTCRSSAVGIP